MLVEIHHHVCAAHGLPEVDRRLEVAGALKPPLAISLGVHTRWKHNDVTLDLECH